MSSWGSKADYGDLSSVIMHRPGRELTLVTAQTLEEFNFERPVNPQRFVTEYDAMLGCFRADGVDTLLLTEILKDDADAIAYMNHRPNMIYTRDLATVFPSGAVLMGPHLKGRWGDQVMLGRAFRRLGIPVVGAIEFPGFLEGGGVTMIGGDTVVASLCDRANEGGTRALRDLVLGKDVRYFLEVPLPFGHIHIDGLFMVLDEKLCLVFEDTFHVFPCRLYEDGTPGFRHVMFLDFLQERGFTSIRLSEEEWRGGHLNVVVTKRGRRAVGFEQTASVAGRMRQFGWELTTFASGEMRAGNGGAHCMTCPVAYT